MKETPSPARRTVNLSGYRRSLAGSCDPPFFLFPVSRRPLIGPPLARTRSLPHTPYLLFLQKGLKRFSVPARVFLPPFDDTSGIATHPMAQALEKTQGRLGVQNPYGKTWAVPGTHFLQPGCQALTLLQEFRGILLSQIMNLFTKTRLVKNELTVYSMEVDSGCQSDRFQGNGCCHRSYLPRILPPYRWMRIVQSVSVPSTLSNSN